MNRPPPASVWTYALPDGWEIVVGKTDADNDRLSLKEARANDWWFHVKGMPGSHVLLRHPEEDDPDRELLKAAAAAAAWHSKARNAGTVAVTYAQAKNVSKPRGAKPGTVQVKQEKTLKVKPGITVTLRQKQD